MAAGAGSSSGFQAMRAKSSTPTSWFMEIGNIRVMLVWLCPHHNASWHGRWHAPFGVSDHIQRGEGFRAGFRPCSPSTGSLRGLGASYDTPPSSRSDKGSVSTGPYHARPPTHVNRENSTNTQLITRFRPTHSSSIACLRFLFFQSAPSLPPLPKMSLATLLKGRVALVTGGCGLGVHAVNVHL